MTRWPLVPIGDVASLTWRPEKPEPTASYRLLGVRLWGQGAYVRQTISGAETKYPQLFRVEEGDIIVNKIWARNGSVSVVSKELAGAYGSPEFPAYVPDRSRLLPRWAYWYTRSPLLWKQCETVSRGTSSQSRLRPERFLAVTVPLAPLDVQHKIVAQLDATQAQLAARRAAAEAAESELRALLRAAFRRATTRAPRARLADVAPLHRRPVAVDLEGAYPELGIRSFGRGTFYKPALSGLEVGTKRLFRIEEGDLLFNIVFAWEGAVAVARPEDAGRFGSHRFLTCVPDPSRATSSFLKYYFLTAEGLQKLRESSPGGAGRNRTLGVKALEAIEVPVPSLDAQHWFDGLQSKAAAVRAAHAAASEHADQLLPSLLDRTFGPRQPPATTEATA